MNEELETIVKERTKDLMISREHFKFLADNIPVIVWTTDENGEVIYFNKRWYEYSGFNPLEGDERMRSIIHGDDLERAIEIWQEGVAGKRPYEFDARFLRFPDQEYRWHHSHAVPFLNDDGKIVAWFGTSIDVDDQKKELEKKDEFIGVASHELKTPLTSLKGYVQLIGGQDNLPPIINQYIKKASESINKLQHLINDLLDVSKIQAGKLKFTTETVNLSELINSWIENGNHIYGDYMISKDIDHGIMVNGNAERLEQVLMNMINNAVKYSPSNKEIIVSAKRTGDQATVTVTDHGIGLSEANQQRIFERFFRVDDHQTQTSGLGMGLFIASEIIREHQGTMKVKSKLNAGSEFSFSLPLVG
jgi:two-component system phosphate regulon sensor histidine kinase PhoR